MEGEAVVPAEVQSGVQAGDEHAVAQALRARREAKIEAAKPKPDKKEIQKPEAKTESKDQPEQKAEKAEPAKQPASSEKEESKSEVPATDDPEAVKAEAATKPEESKEPPRFKVAIDGKDEEVTVDELRSGYMRSRDYTLKTQELAKEREAFSSETTQRKQVVENTINELGVLAQHMVQRLVDEDQRTDWNQLQQTDPEAYAARMTKRLENRELLRTVLAKATQMQGQQKKEQEEKSRAELQSRKKEADTKFPLVIPEWSDPQKAKTERAEVAQFLKERGFSEQEAQFITEIDYRATSLSREAMLYRRIQEAKKKAEGEKKVEAKAPPNPAASAPEGSGAATKVDRLKAKFQRTGDLHDAAKLLAARRTQSRR